MNIGFAGTPSFAATALRAILDAGFAVSLTLTKPDRAQGRGQSLTPSPVKQLALQRGLPVAQPVTLKAPDARAALLAQPLDVLVVAAYGLILPPEVLAWPRHGAINIHASLLPRWRGAAPIHRALMAGDRETGISIMQMDEGLDTGPVISRHPVPISATETGGTLHDRLAETGAQAIVAALTMLSTVGQLSSVPQLEADASYARKITREDTRIRWEGTATEIARSLRAFDPTPGMSSELEGETIKVWKATPAPGQFGTPGSVIAATANGIVVACGQDALIVHELQRPGGRRLSAGAFLAGRSIGPHARFSTARVES